MLDTIADREEIEVTDGDVDQEVERQAALSGRTSQAVRALLEKDGASDGSGRPAAREGDRAADEARDDREPLTPADGAARAGLRTM